MSETHLNIKRAYVALVQKGDDGSFMVWNGREQAIHPKALHETLDSRQKMTELVTALKASRFRDWTHNKTVNGILLIGRSAFSGGRIEIGETPKQAVVREVQEEMGLTITEDLLIDLCTTEDKIFYLTFVSSLSPFQETPEKRSASFCHTAELIRLIQTPDEEDRKFIAKEMTTLANVLLGETEMTKDFAFDMTEWQLAREQPAHVIAAEALLLRERNSRIAKLVEMDSEIWTILSRAFPLVFTKKTGPHARTFVPFLPAPCSCDRWINWFSFHEDLQGRLDFIIEGKPHPSYQENLLKESYTKLQKFLSWANSDLPQE